MDYIREELLRQQSVLRLLMQGGEEPANTSNEVPDSPAQEETVWAAGDTPAAQGRSAARRPSQNGMGGGTAGEVLKFIPGEMGETVQSGADSGLTESDSVRQRIRKETAPPFGGLAERTVTELLWADGGAAWDPREISRVFQRDARRYDGAFTADGKGE